MNYTSKALLIAIISLMIAGASSTHLRAQTKVEQHTVTVDSATGKRTVTTDTIIKKEEDITPYTEMVNINPLAFILAYNLTWVHKLSASTAVSVGAEYAVPHEITAWGVLGEFRFYPSHKSMHGFYLAPNFSYAQASNAYYYSYDTSSGMGNSGYYTAQMLTVGLLIGWQWFPADNFSMGLAFGMSDYIPINSHTGDSFNDVGWFGGMYGNSGVYPALRFDLGYAW